MDIKLVLGELGIHKTKAEVYLAALELGRAKVRTIADKAGVPRTTANEILEHLAHRGLIRKIQRGRTLIFEAEPPIQLKLLLKEQEHKLDEALPELKLLFNSAGFRPRIKFYDRKVSIIGTKKENFGIIIESEDLFQTLNNFFEITWEVGKIGKRVN